MKLSDNPPQSGIYSITNIKTKRIYIGQSNNIICRWYDHFETLTKETHSNRLLQSDFIVYGVDNFELSILEHFNGTQKELLAKEREYIEKYRLDGKILYNNEFIILRRSMKPF